MRLSAKISPRKLGLASASLLCLLGLGGATVAETPKKATAQDQAQPAPKQGATEQARPPIWVVNCQDNKGELVCSAGQAAYVKTTGQRLLTVLVQFAPDTKKPMLMLQVPLGVYLPAGASLQIGKDEAKTLPFTGCVQTGCVAEYAITEGEIAAMIKGSGLTISVQNQNQKPAFTVTVPATGFAAAYAKIK
jgi:invasion protein IalB